MPSPAHATDISDAGIALDEQPAVADTKPAARLDDWQTEQHVRRLGRTLRRAGATPQNATSQRPTDSRRFDPPQNLFDHIEQSTSPGGHAARGAAPTITPATLRRSEGGQAVAWLVAVAGALLLGAGLGTIGWSLAAERTDVWNLAIGLTLAGQGMLIFGLLLVVSRLWRNSRHAASRLRDVHGQLGQLQRTADALAATRTGGAPAFYAELVRGASPQMLLSNLKGQLDQLATRIGSNL